MLLLLLAAAGGGGLGLLEVAGGGVDVAEAGGGGLELLEAGGGGVDVAEAGVSGLELLEAGGGGVDVAEAGGGGLELLEAGGGGVDVAEAVAEGAASGTSAMNVRGFLGADAGQDTKSQEMACLPVLPFGKSRSPLVPWVCTFVTMKIWPDTCCMHIMVSACLATSVPAAGSLSCPQIKCMLLHKPQKPTTGHSWTRCCSVTVNRLNMCAAFGKVL